MKKQTFKLELPIIVLTYLIFSCNQVPGGDPTLEFLTDSKYISESDSLAPGDEITIGLKCTWNGKDALEKIVVSKYFSENDVVTQTITLEPNDSEGVAFSLKYEKTAEEKDSFMFELVDAANQMASLSIVLYKDTSLSDLREVGEIVLGAQDNTTAKQLFSISSYYTSFDITQANAATNIQKNIDFVAAFNTESNFFIGSPAVDFNGTYDFSEWAETDTTKFVIPNLQDGQYEVLNKTKIKDMFESASDKLNIVKNLTTGSIFLFKTQSNKFGAIKVNSVTNAADGSIDFDMKVQR